MSWFDDAMADASDDEMAIAKGFIRKLMGEGRIEHGRMNLAKDERDLLREAADELDDTVSYLMMERRRLELMRRDSQLTRKRRAF